MKHNLKHELAIAAIIIFGIILPWAMVARSVYLLLGGDAP